MSNTFPGISMVPALLKAMVLKSGHQHKPAGANNSISNTYSTYFVSPNQRKSVMQSSPLHLLYRKVRGERSVYCLSRDAD